EAGHDQRLVGGRDLPQHLEQDREDQRHEDHGGDDHDERAVQLPVSCVRGVTKTSRGGWYSTTTISEYGSMDPPFTPRARKASTPPLIATMTSPVRPGAIPPVEVTLPRQPTGDESVDNAALA